MRKPFCTSQARRVESLDPEMKIAPSRWNSIDTVSCVCPSSAGARDRLVAVSHSQIIPLRSPDARTEPSSENWKHEMALVWPRRGLPMGAPDVTSHSLNVVSCAAETTVRLSGENLTSITCCECLVPTHNDRDQSSERPRRTTGPEIVSCLRSCARSVVEGRKAQAL